MVGLWTKCCREAELPDALDVFRINQRVSLIDYRNEEFVVSRTAAKIRSQ